MYLLVSREHPEVFKLGMTGDLLARVTSLALSFGAFNSGASALVRVHSLRVALRLERLLQTAFDAAKWRAESPSSIGKGSPSNGHTEWYRREALEEMLLVVADLIARDAQAGVERFAIERDLSALLQPDDHGGSFNVGGAGQPCGRARAEADGRARNEQNEVAFQRLREFVAGKRDRVLSLGLPTIDVRGYLHRLFTFRVRSSIDTQAHGSDPDEWDELFSLCRLTYRTHREHGGINYLRHCRYLADDQVELEFALDPFFNSHPETFLPPSDLPQRIWAWFAEP